MRLVPFDTLVAGHGHRWNAVVVLLQWFGVYLLLPFCFLPGVRVSPWGAVVDCSEVLARLECLFGSSML